MKNKTLVLGHVVQSQLPVFFQPLFDFAHRRLAGFDEPLAQQNAAYALKRMAVVVRIADTHFAAVIKVGHRRALNLHNVNVNRIITPQQHRSIARTGFDFRPGVIRYQLLSRNPSDVPFRSLIFVKITQVKFYQIIRTAINRIFVTVVFMIGRIQ